MRHKKKRRKNRRRLGGGLVHAYDGERDEGIKMHINPRDPDAREAKSETRRIESNLSKDPEICVYRACVSNLGRSDLTLTW